MESTTIKVSVATRDRIKSYGGPTHEATIVAALDALDARDAAEFWDQAEQARRSYDALSDEERHRIREDYRRVDAAFDAIR